MRTWKNATLSGRVLLACVASAMCVGVVHAESYPDKPIRIIVPYAPGGPSDIVVRAIGRALEKEIAQPFVVENRPGANGTLGAIQVATAKPDGYELAIAPVGIFRQPYIQKTSFHPLRDLTFISALVDYSYMIAVRADSKWTNINDFITDARSHPGKYSYGTPGAFSTPHLSMDELGTRAGIRWTHIPYKSASEIVTALLGKQVDVIAGTGSSTLDQYVANGSVRVLAAISDPRSALHPEWPTLKEQGFPIVASAPFGLVGPAGMKPERVRRIADLFDKAMSDPGFRRIAKDNAIEVRYLGPQAYADYAKNTYAQEGERMPRLMQNIKP